MKRDGKSRLKEKFMNQKLYNLILTNINETI